MKKYVLAMIILSFLHLGGYSQDNSQQATENKGDSFKIIFENGFLIGNPDLQYPMPFSSHLSFEKKYKNLFLGIGSGAEVIGRTYIPFFASIKYIPFKTKPLYIYGKGGYNVCLSSEYKEESNGYINYYYPYYSTEYKYSGGIMAEAGFGIILKMKNWDSSISIGYRYQKTKYETTYNTTDRTYENYYNRLALRFGFWF
jgi:hypothetical protein